MGMRMHGRAVMVAAAVALTGCSTYLGHKVGTDGKLPGNATGLPFTMTRPEYTVDITADPDDAGKAVYTLKVTDVPDPTQRYTLALDPALLTDGKFNLTFGANGNLSEADATLTSQVVATLKAVASFAANRQHALKALADLGSVHSVYLQRLRDNPSDACTAVAQRARESDPPQKVNEKIAADLRNLMAEAESEGSKNPTRDVLNRYHYRNAQERECLQAVWTLIKTDTGKEEETFKKAYDAVANEEAAARKAFEDAAGQMPAQLGEAVKAIQGRVAAGDAESLRSAHAAAPPQQAEVRDLIDKALRYLEAQAFARLPQAKAIKAWVAAGDAESLKKARELIAPAQDKLKTLADKGIDYVGKQKSIAELREYAQTFADMSPTTWRARHAQMLEKRMDKLRVEIRLAPLKDRKKHIEDLAADEAEHAETIGAKTILDRMRQHEKFLAEVKMTTGPDGRPRYAADEHVKLREERDKLKAQFDELKKAHAASIKPAAAKVAARSNVPVQIVSREFVERVNAREALFTAPEYVLVLESSPRAGSEPTVLFGSERK